MSGACTHNLCQRAALATANAYGTQCINILGEVPVMQAWQGVGEPSPYLDVSPNFTAWAKMGIAKPRHEANEIPKARRYIYSAVVQCSHLIDSNSAGNM